MQELFTNRYRRPMDGGALAPVDARAPASRVEVSWRAPRPAEPYRSRCSRDLTVSLRRSAGLPLGELGTLAITCTFLSLWALSVARREAWASLVLPLGLLWWTGGSALRGVVRALSRTTVVLADGRISVFDGPLPLGRDRTIEVAHVAAFACRQARDGSYDLVARLRDGSDARLVAGIPAAANAHVMAGALDEALRPSA